METLTLRERVGLHHLQEALHQLEQDPDGSGFIVGHCFVNSCRHVAEVQLPRGWEPPRLRVLPEFGGHGEDPHQDERGVPHPPPRLDQQTGVKGMNQRALWGGILSHSGLKRRSEGRGGEGGGGHGKKCPGPFKSCRPR